MRVRMLLVCPPVCVKCPAGRRSIRGRAVRLPAASRTSKYTALTSPPPSPTLVPFSSTIHLRVCLLSPKFFEPFIVTVLMSWGLSLTRIGVLVTVEKVTTYVFEMPSGYLADRWGYRKELCLCFVLYMASFVLYSLGEHSYGVLVLAAFAYGLGEALRSGTHKAMVFLWLERHDILSLKSYLNGHTRSFSLLGSAVAAVGGMGTMLGLAYGAASSKWIFLLSVLPYILDFMIIASYPSYMDHTVLAAEGAGAGAEEVELGEVDAAAGAAAGTTATAAAPKKKGKDNNGKGPSTRSAMPSFCADMRAMGVVVRDPNRRRAFLGAVSVGAAHRLLKDFVQVRGREKRGRREGEGRKTRARRGGGGEKEKYRTRNR